MKKNYQSQKKEFDAVIKELNDLPIGPFEMMMEEFVV